jgi:hypothetical protein
MTTRTLQSLRLDLKRVFGGYVLALSSPEIADPTQAFLACWEYLGTLLRTVGPEEFLHRLDDETTQLAGEVHQDLRQRLRGTATDIDYVEVEDRLRECFDYALNQLNGLLTGPQ